MDELVNKLWLRELSILENWSRKSAMWMIAVLEEVKRAYEGKAIINQVVEYFSELVKERSLHVKNVLHASYIDG